MCSCTWSFWQDLCQFGTSVYSQWIQKHSPPLNNFSPDLLCQQWLIKICLLSTGSNHDLATIFFATTNLVQRFTNFSLRCGCHLSKSMKSRIWCFFPPPPSPLSFWHWMWLNLLPIREVTGLQHSEISLHCLFTQ